MLSSEEGNKRERQAEKKVKKVADLANHIWVCK